MKNLAINGGKKTIQKIFDLGATYFDEEINAVTKVIKSQTISGFVANDGPKFYGGNKVIELESLFKEYFNVKFAVASNSATSSLHSALVAIGIEKGDEVIVPSVSMSASAASIIMAGGKGTRLEPFTDLLPKPLIPVNKKPVIEHIIKNFENYGVKKFILSINYKAQILKAYFNELKPSYKLKFIYENKPLGTIGSLSKIKKSEAKNFFITNCDTISSINLISMYKFHLQNNYDLTILASSKKHQIPYGVCYARKNSDLIEIKEKPKFDFLVNAGLYLAKNSILNFVPKNKRYDFTDLVKILKSKNKKVGIFTVYENNWLDVGQWDEFKKTVSFFS